jgi:microcompartment protein CcmL/EutN
MAFGERAHGMPGSGTPGRVVWAIEAGPDEAAQTGEPVTPHVIMRLSATLTPVAYGTAVSVDIEPAGGDDPARIDALDRQFPAMARLWRAIAGEQVDAVLTQRPFDMLNIRSAMASAAMSQLSQIGKQMNEAAKEVQRREEETIDRAYALDKHGD